jgi:shikimate 5-dehydrogenase
MNAIYKSFSVDNIESAVMSARILGFKGFGISMPFKKEVLKYVDETDSIVDKIGAANTIVNTDGVLKAYNTDYLAVKEVMLELGIERKLVILGNGGFASAAKHACIDLNIDYKIIDRSNWGVIDSLENCVIFNCTPVSGIKVSSNVLFIDARPITEIGMLISQKQARYQFELYTNKKFPLC